MCLSKNKKKKINDVLLLQIQQLKGSRENAIDEYYLSFIVNIYKEMSFRDYFTKQTDDIKENQALYETAISYSIISLVSCWETFFRDVFVFIINSNENIKSMLLQNEDTEKQSKLVEFDAVADYFSKLYNFQRINEIKEAFYKVLNEIDIFLTVGDFIIPYIEDGIVYKFSLNHSFQKWLELVEYIFEERHKIVHDANYNTDIKINDLEKAENAFLYFPQIFSIWLNLKFSINANILMINQDKNKLPALLTREQMVQGKWYIKNE